MWRWKHMQQKVCNVGRIHKEVHKHGVYKRGKSFFLIRALMLLDLKIWD